MRRALVIGINDYPPPNELRGCVNDAVEFASKIETNGDGSPNFDVNLLTSASGDVTTKVLDRAVRELFAPDKPAETVLLYFAGHGLLDSATNQGWLVSQDGDAPTWGVSLSAILGMANAAQDKIQSSVIMLDCCHAGFMGEISGLGGGHHVSVIGNGLTILTATHRLGAAEESGGHGTFTSILLDGLEGAASDVLGRITPASLYAHVDQTLGAWEQRPIYKANVQNFISLREVPAKVDRAIIRRLVRYFPSATSTYKLDPSYEPDRGEEADRLRHIPVDPDNERIYRELQKCNNHGLITPIDHEHMWHTAVHSGRVKLTATGAHYRRLAEKKRI